MDMVGYAMNHARNMSEVKGVSCALGPNDVVIYLINKMRCDFI